MSFHTYYLSLPSASSSTAASARSSLPPGLAPVVSSCVGMMRAAAVYQQNSVFHFALSGLQARSETSLWSNSRRIWLLGGWHVPYTTGRGKSQTSNLPDLFECDSFLPFLSSLPLDHALFVSLEREPSILWRTKTNVSYHRKQKRKNRSKIKLTEIQEAKLSRVKKIVREETGKHKRVNEVRRRKKKQDGDYCTRLATISSWDTFTKGSRRESQKKARKNGGQTRRRWDAKEAVEEAKKMLRSSAANRESEQEKERQRRMERKKARRGKGKTKVFFTNER